MENFPSSGTTPRDDRFYTPRAVANSICSSNDDFFTPRFNTYQRTESGNNFINADSKSETGSDYFQTPRSARQFEDLEYSNNRINSNMRRNSYSKESVNGSSPRYSNNIQSREELPYPHTEKKIPKNQSQPAYNTAKKLSPQYEYDNTYTSGGYEDTGDGDMDVLGVEEPVSSTDVEDIFRFARHGRCEEMEKLLEFGIPIDIRDSNGSTLLITACQNGNKKIVKSLLRRGANINIRNFKGNSALHYCTQFGYSDTLGEYLITKVCMCTIYEEKCMLYLGYVY